MPAASPVNLHSPVVPVRAVLLILALWGLTAIFSLRPFNVPAPAAFVLSSAPFPGEGNPKGLPTAPPVESEVKLGRAQGHLLGSFRVTFYWLVEENKYPGERTTPLYALSGELLGNFPERFVRDFRMESCALLRDGRILSGPVAGNRCRVVTAPVGCNDLALDALRSVAVDPAVIPLGAKLYIPDADGTPLGGGARHDGFFRAQDVGGFIRGRRIDIYLGAKSSIEYFTATALCCPGHAEVYLVP